MRRVLCGLAVALLASAARPVAADALQLAIGRLDAGDSAGARLLLIQALKQTPNDGELLYQLGRAEQRLGEPQAAVEHLQHAVELRPANADYRFRLGLALSRYIDTVSTLRKPAVAERIRDSLSKAVELKPDFLDARDALLKYDLAAPGFLGGGLSKARDQAAAIAQRDDAYGHVANAEIASYQGQDSNAITEYQAALQAAPKNRDAVLGLCRLYQRMRRFDESFDVIRQALHEDPDDGPAQYEFGHTAVLAGHRLEEGVVAVKAYLKYVSRDEDDPTQASAHLLLGLLYEKLHRREQAREEYQLTLKLDPGLDEARQALRALE